MNGLGNLLLLYIYFVLFIFLFHIRSRSFSVPRYTPVVEVSSTTGLPKTDPPPEPTSTKIKRIKKVKSHKKKKSHRSKSSQIETVFIKVSNFIMKLNLLYINIFRLFYINQQLK